MNAQLVLDRRDPDIVHLDTGGEKLDSLPYDELHDAHRIINRARRTRIDVDQATINGQQNTYIITVSGLYPHLNTIQVHLEHDEADIRVLDSDQLTRLHTQFALIITQRKATS